MPRRSDAERERTCPSGRCRSGSVLLGIRGPGGALIYTPSMPPLDDALAEEFAAGGGTASYRFAETCVTTGCLHWDGSSCVLATALVREAAAGEEPEDGLPWCSIRATCRWFAQEGKDACAVCPRILRDEPMIAEVA